MEQYCIYLRKSRADMEAEAKGEGETLKRHKEALVELSKKMGLNVKSIYKEVISGETISARPVMQKLLSEVEQGLWDGVLVMEIERLARGNTIDQGIVAQTFHLSGTKIITPMKIYDPNNEFDEEYFEFGLFMSRREYKTINRRLQRGRLASVKEGKYVANQPPYGYNRKKIENDKGYTLEPNKTEANVVKLIFELYTQGELQNNGTYNRLGTGLIANKLNSMSIKPKRGKHWVSNSIRDILINPVYIGKIRWNWRPVIKKMVNGKIITTRPRSSLEDCVLTGGLHPPIIEKSVFEAAQETMKKSPPNPIKKEKTVKNPLAGLIVCGKCGRKMVRRPYPIEKNQADTIMCTASNCDNVSSALYLVENKILLALKEWLSEYKLSWKNEEKEHNFQILDIKKDNLKEIETNIEKLKNQINKTYELLEQGIYSQKTFLERSSLNTKKLEKLKKEKEKLKSDLSAEILKNENKKNIIPKIEKLLSVYENLKTPKAKNDMLKNVLEKVIYTKLKGGRWHSDPEDFEIILYPKLPDSSVKSNN